MNMVNVFCAKLNLGNEIPLSLRQKIKLVIINKEKPKIAPVVEV
jgi:hypothetical protein